MAISDNEFPLLVEYCRQENLDVVDNRPKKGVLWVKYLIPEGHIALTLKQMGLRFADGKGWWTN